MPQLQSVRKPIKYGGVIAGIEEINAVVEVLKGQAWGCGEITAEFERAAAKEQNRNFALFVNSGSSALLLALATLPKGARVAMPALQFPTLYSSAIWCGLQPVLVDSDDSFNLDPARLKDCDDLDAVAFVHLAGNPTNIRQVAEFCAERGIPLIEDNCEGFGGTVVLESTVVKGQRFYESWRKVGNWGAISCTSTHAAHQIATGEGGLVFCDDEELYWKMKRIRDWGRAYGAAKLDDYYEHYVFSEFGLNLHASDLQAALGLVQLERLGEFSSLRRSNYYRLHQALADLPITLPRQELEAFPSWYTFPFLCAQRDRLREYLEAAQIETRTILVGNLLRQPLGIEGPACPVADDIFRRGLWFSVHPRLTRDDSNYIIGQMRAFFGAA